MTIININKVRYMRFCIYELVLIKPNPVGKSEDNTAAKFFRLYNRPCRLNKKVRRNSFIFFVTEKQDNWQISWSIFMEVLPTMEQWMRWSTIYIKK